MDPNRKHYPIYSGFLKYFPKAIAYVSHVSWVGNEQHNPGEELHWAKEKSTDHLDALSRHLTVAEEKDSDGVLHIGKVAWRALAQLETILEKEGWSLDGAYHSEVDSGDDEWSQWFEWDGRLTQGRTMPNNVNPSDLVEVVLRDGDGGGGAREAMSWRWDHATDFPDYDIIKYRIKKH